MIIIGEKINGSIPAVADAIARRDDAFIKERALLQAKSNATFIDCCASVPESQELETLRWMIDCIQSVTDLPISVDSPSAKVLSEAYKFCKRPGLFNSVSGEGDKIARIFPLMACIPMAAAVPSTVAMRLESSASRMERPSRGSRTESRNSSP